MRRLLSPEERGRIAGALSKIEYAADPLPQLTALRHFVEGDPSTSTPLVKQTTAVAQLVAVVERHVETGPPAVTRLALGILGDLAVHTQSQRMHTPFHRPERMRLLCRVIEADAHRAALPHAADLLEQMCAATDGDGARNAAWGQSMPQLVLQRLKELTGAEAETCHLARVLGALCPQGTQSMRLQVLLPHIGVPAASLASALVAGHWGAATAVATLLAQLVRLLPAVAAALARHHPDALCLAASLPSCPGVPLPVIVAGISLVYTVFDVAPEAEAALKAHIQSGGGGGAAHASAASGGAAAHGGGSGAASRASSAGPAGSSGTSRPAAAPPSDAAGAAGGLPPAPPARVASAGGGSFVKRPDSGASNRSTATVASVAEGTPEVVWHPELAAIRQFIVQSAAALATIRRDHYKADVVATALRQIHAAVRAAPPGQVELFRLSLGVAPTAVRTLLLPIASVDETLTRLSCDLLGFVVDGSPAAAQHFVVFGGAGIALDLLDDYSPVVLQAAYRLLTPLCGHAAALRALVDHGVAARAVAVWARHIAPKLSRQHRPSALPPSASPAGAAGDDADADADGEEGVEGVGAATEAAVQLGSAALVFFTALLTAPAGAAVLPAAPPSVRHSLATTLLAVAAAAAGVDAATGRAAGDPVGAAEATLASWWPTWRRATCGTAPGRSRAGRSPRTAPTIAWRARRASTAGSYFAEHSSKADQYTRARSPTGRTTTAHATSCWRAC